MSTNTKMAEALREIADAHIPDMPSAWNDPSSWAERQHARLRRIAREALRQYEQAKPAEPVASLMTNIQSGDVEVVWNDDGFDRELWHETPLYADPVEQASKAVPALYVGLIERLMRLSTRLGIAYEGGVEHFAESLEDRLYAICRGAESLLNSVATPPAPEAQQAAGQELPSLPYPQLDSIPAFTEPGYTADQMRAYARAALAQHREPLTDDDAYRIVCEFFNQPWYRRVATEVVRATEKAHGIGATTGKEPGNV